jgi:hypothetical protein
VLTRMPDGSTRKIRQLAQTGATEVIAADTEGTCWRISRKPEPGCFAEIYFRQANEGNFGTLWERKDILAPASVTASSHVDGYSPSAVQDRTLSTCWASSPTNSTDAWIDFAFTNPVVISEVFLLNGWIAKPYAYNTFGLNHRAKSVAAICDGKKAENWDLRDVNNFQILRPAEKRPLRTIRLVIDDIYPAEVVKPDDPPWLTIAEVVFFGESVEKKEAAGSPSPLPDGPASGDVR